MNKLIFILAFILPQILLCQQISLNKDSLSITSILPHDYTGPVEFYYYDSLWIKNVGDGLLIIDSIKTEKLYSYRIKITYKESVDYTILYNDMNLTPLSILPQDSIKIVFADPDLCPICKTSSVVESFSDKLYFYSNSKNNSIYEVDVKGQGFYTTVNEEIPKSDNNLYQNYPNPFNPTTKIRFNIKGNHRVRIIITNTLGHFIRELVNKYYYEGNYEVQFNGEQLSSGVYYYSLILENHIITKKLMLIK